MTASQPAGEIQRAQAPVTIPTGAAAKSGGRNRIIITANNLKGLSAEEHPRLSFERYMKNPVVMWNHGAFMSGEESIPIAKTTSIERNAKGDWVAEFVFLTGNKLAESVRNAYDKGFINAASVGWVYDEDGNPVIVEWSLVAVPRDPDCLRAGYENFMKELFPGEESMSDDAKNKDGKGTPEAASEQQAQTGGVTVNINTAGGDGGSSAPSSGKETPGATSPPAAASEEDKGKGGGEGAQQASAEDIAKRVAARADLAVRVAALTGKEVSELASKPSREILLAAAEHLKVEDADKQSDEYLRAALDFVGQRQDRTAPVPGQPNVKPGDDKEAKGPRVASVSNLMKAKFSGVKRG